MMVSTGVKGITIDRRDTIREDAAEEITEVEDGADAAVVALGIDTIMNTQIIRRTVYR